MVENFYKDMNICSLYRLSEIIIDDFIPWITFNVKFGHVNKVVLTNRCTNRMINECTLFGFLGTVKTSRVRVIELESLSYVQFIDITSQFLKEHPNIRLIIRKFKVNTESVLFELEKTFKVVIIPLQRQIIIKHLEVN